MEKVTKEIFAKWAKHNNWLKVNELSTNNGRQETYLLPSGGLRAIIYDLESNFYSVASLGPPEPPAPPGFTGGLGDLLGGKGFPSIGGKG